MKAALNATDIELLQRATSGQGPKEIAAAMGKSVRAIEWRWTRIIRITQAQDRIHAVALTVGDWYRDLRSTQLGNQ